MKKVIYWFESNSLSLFVIHYLLIIIIWMLFTKNRTYLVIMDKSYHISDALGDQFIEQLNLDVEYKYQFRFILVQNSCVLKECVSINSLRKSDGSNSYELKFVNVEKWYRINK